MRRIRRRKGLSLSERGSRDGRGYWLKATTEDDEEDGSSSSSSERPSVHRAILLDYGIVVNDDVIISPWHAGYYYIYSTTI